MSPALLVLSRRRQIKVSGPAQLTLSTPLPKGGGFQRQSLRSLIAMSEISLLPRRRIISKPKLPPSHQAALHPASLSRHHIPHPRRLCQRQTGPGPSAPAPSRQRPTFVGPLPCPAARQQKAHRGKPLCTICIGAKLLYRFGSVGRGHSGVGGRSGC